MTDIAITYSSYAEPPKGIKVGRIYQLGKDTKGYFISDVHNVKYMNIENIKTLFAPIEKSWEDVLTVKKNTENK